MGCRRGRGHLPGNRLTLASAILLGMTVGSLRAQSIERMPAACTVPDAVEQSLARIARRVGGEVGISALHLESGSRVSFNGDRRFPMASVSKLPMALEFLRLVDSGEIDPDEMIVVSPREFRPGHSPLAAWSGGRRVRRTVDSLFSLMMRSSDNTATDVILNMSGGPQAATRRIRELGVTGVEVNRSEARTFADLVGLSDTIPESELWRYQYFRMRNALPQSFRDAARERYGTDPRDTATPNGMTDLLAHIHDGTGLSPESHARLLEVMTLSRSGPRRIKGRLPAPTAVAHKTGTMAGAINDVGIITLPDDAGTLVISAFVNTLRVSSRQRERTIAEMARALYDYFGGEYAGLGTAVVGTNGPGQRPCAS